MHLTPQIIYRVSLSLSIYIQIATPTAPRRPRTPPSSLACKRGLVRGYHTVGRRTHSPVAPRKCDGRHRWRPWGTCDKPHAVHAPAPFSCASSLCRPTLASTPPAG
eukprot:1184426-Prorocentrum_minimum.AAC.4